MGLSSMYYNILGRISAVKPQFSHLAEYFRLVGWIQIINASNILKHYDGYPLVI